MKLFSLNFFFQLREVKLLRKKQSQQNKPGAAVV